MNAFEALGRLYAVWPFFLARVVEGSTLHHPTRAPALTMRRFLRAGLHQNEYLTYITKPTSVNVVEPGVLYHIPCLVVTGFTQC